MVFLLEMGWVVEVCSRYGFAVFRASSYCKFNLFHWLGRRFRGFGMNIKLIFGVRFTGV